MLYFYSSIYLLPKLIPPLKLDRKLHALRKRAHRQLIKRNKKKKQVTGFCVSKDIFHGIKFRDGGYHLHVPSRGVHFLAEGERGFTD